MNNRAKWGKRLLITLAVIMCFSMCCTILSSAVSGHTKTGEFTNPAIARRTMQDNRFAADVIECLTSFGAVSDAHAASSASTKIYTYDTCTIEVTYTSYGSFSSATVTCLDGTVATIKSLYYSTYQNGYTAKANIIYANGDTYVGDLKNGYKDGYNAKYTWADGSMFSGTFSQDMMESGTYSYSENGKPYEVYITFSNGSVDTSKVLRFKANGINSFLTVEDGKVIHVGTTSSETREGLSAGYTWSDEGKKYYHNWEPYCGWLYLNEQTYYFDENGKMVTGLTTIDGETYSFNASGCLISGWQKSSSSSLSNSEIRYFDEEGRMVTGVREINGFLFSFGSDGLLNRFDEGWHQLSNGSWVYATDNYVLAKGWLQDDYKWYYMRDNGSMATGWQNADGNWYYFDGAGVMQSGWVYDGGWYLLNANGVMVTGWYNDGDRWYLFKNSGQMAASEWASDGTGWYYFDASGQYQTGWLHDGGVSYYLDKTGRMKTGWIQDKGKWYYMDDGGAMVTDWKQLSGIWYYFNPDGAMATAWKQLNGIWYYFNSDGAMVTGWKKLSGSWYYFGSDGAMVTGWKQLSGTWYYFGSDGAMVTGTQTINGTVYTFDAGGVWIN